MSRERPVLPRYPVITEHATLVRAVEPFGIRGIDADLAVFHYIQHAQQGSPLDSDSARVDQVLRRLIDPEGGQGRLPEEVLADAQRTIAEASALQTQAQGHLDESNTLIKKANRLSNWSILCIVLALLLTVFNVVLIL